MFGRLVVSTSTRASDIAESVMTDSVNAESFEGAVLDVEAEEDKTREAHSPEPISSQVQKPDLTEI